MMSNEKMDAHIDDAPTPEEFREAMAEVEAEMAETAVDATVQELDDLQRIIDQQARELASMEGVYRLERQRSEELAEEVANLLNTMETMQQSIRMLEAQVAQEVAARQKIGHEALTAANMLDRANRVVIDKTASADYWAQKCGERESVISELQGRLAEETSSTQDWLARAVTAEKEAQELQSCVRNQRASIESLQRDLADAGIMEEA